MNGWSGLLEPLTDGEWQAVALSLRVSIAGVLVGLPPAIGAGWLLGRVRFAGKPLLDAFVHLPIALPPVVVGYVLLLLFGIRGPVGGPLDDWFGVRLVFTTNAVVLATIVMTFPLLVRAVRLALDAVDPGLEDAARTLGARPFDRFFSVTLPLMGPGLLAGAVTAFAAGLGEFGAVITFASNIPGETQTLPLAIYAALQSPGGEVTAARLSCISFALALLALLAAEHLARLARRRD